MSDSIEVLVRTKDGDGRKLYKAVEDVRQEAIDETGDPSYRPIEILSLTPTEYVLFGDCYDVGDFMIRLFTQKVWCGGAVQVQSPDIYIRCSRIPVWDGTYDPLRASEEELMREEKELEEEELTRQKLEDEE